MTMIRKDRIKVNLANQAYDEIRKRIYDNDIKPGELISESLIAQELEISRTPIREAIRMLASENLVETRDGIGTIVKMFSFKEIKDIFEVRKSLEVIAVKTSINNILESEILVLLNKYSDISARFHAGELIDKEFTILDMQVHDLIVSKCNNDYVKSLFASINLKIRLYQHIQYLKYDSTNESISQHMAILNLLKSKDLNKLINTLQEHIDWSLNWYLQAIL